MTIPKLRRILLALLAPLVSIALFVATGELALRVIYRDGGRTTLGGPGGHKFEHLFVFGDRRGPFDDGPRRPGYARVMVMGDSVTWGLGVRDWWDLWPEQLENALERRGQPTEMAVYALPGRGIAEHLAELQGPAGTVQPDVLIYQWHPNDIEVVENRPYTERPWQMWRFHERLRQLSYLYYFLDNRLMMFVNPPERSYRDYLLADFATGTLGWAEFERVFHSFATLAKEVAPRRLMVLYPQVPFSGSYPLQPINDWMKRIAGPHTLALSPATWEIRTGQRLKQADAPWGEIARAQAGRSGTLFETRPYYTGDGPLDLTVQVACESQPAGSELGTLEIVDVVTAQVVAHAPLKAAAGDAGWFTIPVHLTINGIGDHTIRFRVQAAGVGAFSIGTIDLAVDYGIEVIDLADRLNTFNTHTSIFDGHPNKRAHAVIAETVLEALGTVKPTH